MLESGVELIFNKGQLQDFSSIPRFTWLEESPVVVAQRVALSLVGLLAPALAIGAFGFVRLGQYPVAG